MFDIKEELSKLPIKPGVYLMKDARENIIYVGKAIVLKNRVRQYFQASANHTSKIKKMVSQIQSFEYIVTDSEMEALILECNLIKKHRPRYNTLLKDDKTFPYIKVTVQEEFPRVIYTRTVERDKAKYFGPYTNALAAKDIIELLRKIWKIRSCSRKLPENIGKERPCLYYHIGQCNAPCQGYIGAKEYKANIDEVIGFLSGNFSQITALLKEKMEAASENLDFEKAAEYRDQLKSINVIAEKQKIEKANNKDQDIVGCARDEKSFLIQVFFIRNGKMVGREQISIKNTEEMEQKEVLGIFIKQFYSGSPYVPKEIILQEQIEEAGIIEEWLSDRKGQKVSLLVPQKGDKSKLLHLAQKNAEISLKQFGDTFRKKQLKTKGAITHLYQLLNLEQDNFRVEAYDISNTQGLESVGAMVVFEEGEPKKREYRKFRIKTVTGTDDYASMQEVVTRRFQRGLEEQKQLLIKGLDKEYGKFSKFPGLLLVDGGKGHVSAVTEALELIGMEIPVCGMVKDDTHHTRGLIYNNLEIDLSKHQNVFNLVTRIQDEVHRFAIEYHRNLRGKAQLESVLDQIKGIGPKSRKALLLDLGSVEAIKEATLEELQKVKGINIKQAEAVYYFFR